MKRKHKFRAMIGLGLIMWLLLIQIGKSYAFEFKDVTSIGVAYITNVFLHEVGHQVVANDVDADSPKMSFLTHRNGKFYPGLFTCKDVSKESILPLAAGGERMTNFTFEYALESYRHKPTTFNKGLLFFACTDFLINTIRGNIHHEDDTFDSNIIRAETGLKKGELLWLAMVKSLINTYRVFNRDANFTPIIQVDRDSAALMICFHF